MTLDRTNGEPYRVLVIVSITNGGPPSILHDFSLRVTLKSGRELKTENILIKNPIPLFGQLIFQHHSLAEKTGTTAIPTGGRVVGVHFSQLIDLGERGNFIDATKELFFKDAFGNQYKVELLSDELENRRFYVPGL